MKICQCCGKTVPVSSLANYYYISVRHVVMVSVSSRICKELSQTKKTITSAQALSSKCLCHLPAPSWMIWQCVKSKTATRQGPGMLCSYITFRTVRPRNRLCQFRNSAPTVAVRDIGGVLEKCRHILGNQPPTMSLWSGFRKFGFSC